MRHIVKESEPDAYRDFREHAERGERAGWHSMNSTAKRELYTALLHEQGYCCCYCGRRVGHKSSHVEHVKPRNTFPEYAYDYRNLAASCIKNPWKGMPLHCGHKKAEWYEGENFVSPHQPDCEDRFAYGFNGAIRPASESDIAAKTTIQKLGLDLDRLRVLRSEALNVALDGVEDMSAEVIEALIRGYRNRSKKDNFAPFSGAILSALNKILKLKNKTR